MGDLSKGAANTLQPAKKNIADSVLLVAVEDILHACKALKDTDLPMSLHTFQSGVMVLRSWTKTPVINCQKHIADYARFGSKSFIDCSRIKTPVTHCHKHVGDYARFGSKSFLDCSSTINLVIHCQTHRRLL
jgi:hypothetical protein